MSESVKAEIEWVGPEVAQTWPFGSTVLAHRLDEKLGNPRAMELHQHWNSENMKFYYNENAVFAKLDDSNLLKME